MATFLDSFQTLGKNFKIKPKTYYIDNWIFRLHYFVTTLLFLLACVLVTSRQYVGEHIKCITDGGVPEHVMNTFCFFTTTFTLVEHYNDEMVLKGNVAHPGVGPFSMNPASPVQRHAYYQWVPFLLFGQAIMFHLTHLLWKSFEGGRIRRLMDGLHFGPFALLEKDYKVKLKEGEKTVPSKEQQRKYMATVRKAFIDRILYNNSWSRWLVLCEILNVFNVVLQIYITNEFLDKHFLDLGLRVAREGSGEPVTRLDEVFPKVTKCTFYKYGPSGSIQSHDAMCVMALNIINEKIYIFLWYWLWILFTLTCLAVFWRLTTFILHARSNSFNKLVFASSCPGKMNPWCTLTVTQQCNFNDWIFLRYLAKNMDPLSFKELFIGLAEDLDDKNDIKSPLLIIDTDEESGTFVKSEKSE